jgi:phenylacetic acid degradation operon negative regulatory protein
MGVMSVSMSKQDSNGASDEGSPELLRRQAALRPQHLLLTLFGDYWFGRREHLPSAALVRLLVDFGVSEASARAGISRLRRRGLIEPSRIGRNTYYGLTARSAAVLTEGRERIMAFGTVEREWDGRWTLVCFSIPEEQRNLRQTLRTRLRWLGFAPLYDGVWVSPADLTEQVSDELPLLGVRFATVVLGDVASGTPELGQPISAWDLKSVARSYNTFIADFEGAVPRAQVGEIGAAEALAMRTRLMDRWRTFPALDPELPSQILPSDWPRRRARRLFEELYDMLGEPAAERVREILQDFGSDLAQSVDFHTSVKWAKGA